MKAVVNSKNFKKMVSRQNGIFNSKKGQDALIRLQFDLSQVTMSVYGQKEMIVLSAECDADEVFDVVFIRDNLPKVDTKISDLIIKVENHRLFFNDVEIDFAFYSEDVYKYPKPIAGFDKWVEKCSVNSNEVVDAFRSVYPTRMQDDKLEKLMGFKVDPGRKQVYTLDGYRLAIYNINCQGDSCDAFTVPDYTYKTLKAIVGKSNQQLTFYTITGDIIAICGYDFTYYANSQYENDEETLSLFNKVIKSFDGNRDYIGNINHSTLMELDKEYKSSKKAAEKDDDHHFCVMSRHYDDLYISHYFDKKYGAATYSPYLIEGYSDLKSMPEDYHIYFNMRYISEVVNILDSNEDIIMYLPENISKQVVIENGNKLSVMILPMMMSNYIYDMRCIDEVIKGSKELKDVV